MGQATIRLFDTLGGGLTELVPREPGVVRMYTCGPTVYNYTHIGHLRPALVADVLARHLRGRGYVVHWVSNFTDIDDRIIQIALREGVPATAVAQRYIDDYLAAMTALGISSVERYAKVTEHIPDILEMVAGLIERGYAYPLDGDVYFSVRQKADYGKLAGRSLDQMHAGARVAIDPRKRDPMDFALWKAAKPGEPSWDSPWGPGRPGWHIECSAMSLRYLGDGFDIHGGGSDLIFPHHENEIAQSEAFTGGPRFVRIWLHNAMVQIDGEKMSKSLNNFVALRDLVARHPAGALRAFVLSTHYRKPLQYSDQAVAEARRAWTRLVEAEAAWRAAAGGAAPASGALFDRAAAAESAFLAALDDDLNSAGALGALHELVRAGNAALAAGAAPGDLAAAHAVLARSGEILGLWEGEGPSPATAGRDAEGLIELLIELRGEARAYRDWALADRIRDGLATLGIALEDTAAGTRWKRADAAGEPALR